MVDGLSKYILLKNNFHAETFYNNVKNHSICVSLFTKYQVLYIDEPLCGVGIH